MRRIPVWFVAVAVGIGSGVAAADPVVELGTFVGARWFDDKNGLGNSPYADQVVRDSGLAGVRVAWVALPHIGGSATDATRVQLAIEAEGSAMPTRFGSARDSGGARPARAAGLFGGRGQLALRLAHWDAVPHLVVGGGLEYLSSRSADASDEADPVLYYGIGATAPLTSRLELRFDVRHAFMPGRDGDPSSSIEVQLGLQLALGGTYQRPPIIEYRPRISGAAATHEHGPGGAPPSDGGPRATVVTPVPPPVPTDRDHDGIVGAADRCPEQAEDLDGNADTDGCPDPDNDRDGILDAVDHCPNELETKNQWLDDDGCPDQPPPDLGPAVALVATVEFQPKRARVTPAGRVILQRMLKQLEGYPKLVLVLAGHPGTKDSDESLAKKRAEAVKWYLVDQGFVATQIEVTVGGVARQAVTATYR